MLTEFFSEDQSSLYCFAGAGNILDGKGTWNGATGAYSLSGCIDSSQLTFTYIATSRIFIPGSPQKP